MELCPVYICLSSLLKCYRVIFQQPYEFGSLYKCSGTLLCCSKIYRILPLSLAKMFYSNQTIMYESNQNKEMDQAYSMTLHAWSTPSGTCTIFCGSHSQGGATDAAVMRVQMLMSIHVVSIGILFTLHIKSCIIVNYRFYLKVQPILQNLECLVSCCIFYFYFLFQKNTKGKQKVEEKGSSCDLLIFFSKSPKNLLEFIFYGVFMKEKAHIMRTN